ncbi:MAG: STAS domain-containing protein [Blastocatellia bacterium]|nr:STAS domain-containing protein [Blastocatellia bacterium]
MQNEYDGPKGGVGKVLRRPTRYRLAKKTGTVNILEVSGRLAPNDANDELCKRIDSLIQSGEKDFLLDLSGVSYISSTGVGSLLQTYHHAARVDGHVKLLTPSQCVVHILKISKLDNVFEVFEHEDEAVKSFDPEAVPPPTAEKKVRIRKPKAES